MDNTDPRYMPLRCADAEPSTNHVLDTLEVYVAIVKVMQGNHFAVRRLRADAANWSSTDTETSHSMQASVTLCP
jgi:hypothetical protein